MYRSIALVALFLAATLSLMCGVQPAYAAGAFVATATVDGQKADAATAGKPIPLIPDKSLDVIVEMTNRGSQPVNVRQVEFTGRVLGLTFFSYATPVDVTVQPGQTEVKRYRLDLTGLKGQATGLIGAEFIVKDGAGKPLVKIPTVTDVRGSLWSVYGLFGIFLLAMTAFALVDAGIALARHRLSANRWQRGMRLFTPGIGIGLVAAFSASVLRLWVPSTGLWLTVAGLTAAVFFALGYFSPTPEDSEDKEFEEDEEDDDDDDLGILDGDTEDFSARERRR